MRLTRKQVTMLRQTYNYGQFFPKTPAEKRTARSLEKRGLVNLITHDNEGYECWVIDVTSAGERAYYEVSCP